MIDFRIKYGTWALVAGASEGLGAAFAEELAKRGLNLILIARRIEKLEELSKTIRNKYPIEIKCQSIDLADYAQIKNFVSQLDVDPGVLVYNAAYAPIGYFDAIAEDKLQRIVDVNISTPLLLVKLMSVKMIEKGKGGIVLMSSLAGAQGSPKIATYAASKAFNATLAEGLWYELKNHGIDVLASCAGAVSTPGYKNAQHSKKAPGTLDADQVAAQTLNALGNGPTIIPGAVNKIAHFMMVRLIPKKLAISIMGKNTKHLT
jgi:short-subunit dehydrogenase